MKTLASFLKERRIAAGLSQIDVSRKLGYTSAQFVSNWERGIAKPPIEALAKIIKLYPVDREEVLDRYLLATKSRLEAVLVKRNGKKLKLQSPGKPNART